MSTPAWLRAARAQWTFRGEHRPAFAHDPGLDQLSVWDFPRPPLLREVSGAIEVRRGDVVVARSTRGHMVCETAHPPTYYFPRADVDEQLLQSALGASLCEWKGAASSFDVLGGPALRRAAWTYEAPLPEFAALQGAIAFMPADLDCFVDGERARPQPGGFYGGWITSRYVGPFKGEPGIAG